MRIADRGLEDKVGTLQDTTCRMIVQIGFMGRAKVVHTCTLGIRACTRTERSMGCGRKSNTNTGVVRQIINGLLQVQIVRLGCVCRIVATCHDTCWDARPLHEKHI